MKIVTIVGARPQFIKAAAISRVINKLYTNKIKEVIIHTGQHFDENMSRVFFDELNIPVPSYNLSISGGSHGSMTGKMIESIELALKKESPDYILIYGDTNSTLAGAIAASKLHIPIAHVEAGLRSYNMKMPEEVNRILSDRISTLLFCPTQAAVTNLAKEGINKNVFNVGDVMFDVSKYYKENALIKSVIKKNLGIEGRKYILTTCHRAENTDTKENISNIINGLEIISDEIPVIFPMHPRTRNMIKSFGLDKGLKNVIVIDPLSFMDMIAMEYSAEVILTDSGGVQKEAFFYDVPCVTMREETEWTETIDLGWNKLAGNNVEKIVKFTKEFLKCKPTKSETMPYGNGSAAEEIVKSIYQSK